MEHQFCHGTQLGTQLFASSPRITERIKTPSEEKKYFVCRNGYPDLVKYQPTIKAGYIMIKDKEGVRNKLASIHPVRQNIRLVSASGQAQTPPDEIHKGLGSLMLEKPPIQNRFTNIQLENFSASSGQSEFFSALYGNSDGGNEWSNVSKIAKYFNTYMCSLESIVNLTIESMDSLLGCVFSAKAGNKTVLEISPTHKTDPKYGSFLSFHHSFSGGFVTIRIGEGYTIAVYGNTLVQLGGEVIEEWYVFHIPGIREPLYLMLHHRRLPYCG